MLGLTCQLVLEEYGVHLHSELPAASMLHCLCYAKEDCVTVQPLVAGACGCSQAFCQLPWSLLQLVPLLGALLC